jgi:hypothetical protein
MDRRCAPAVRLPETRVRPVPGVLLFVLAISLLWT